MKKIIAFAFIASLFINCSDNDMDNTKLEEEIPVLPVTIKFNNKTLRTIKYDGAKISEIIDSNINNPYDVDKTTYQYDGDNIISIKNYENGKVLLTQDFIYKNGKIDSKKRISQEINSNNEPYLYTTNFDYNWISNDHLKVTNSSSQLVVEYFFTNGEIKHILVPGTKHIFTYDNHNSPFKNVKGWSNLNIDLATEGVQNVLKREDINLVGPGSFSVIYDYEYNTNKYPTKISVTTQYEGTNTLKETREYTYNK